VAQPESASESTNISVRLEGDLLLMYLTPNRGSQMGQPSVAGRIALTLAAEVRAARPEKLHSLAAPTVRQPLSRPLCDV